MVANKAKKEVAIKKPKIGLIDIETSPLEVYAWDLWERNTGLDQIKTEWSILSYAAKWLDSDKVIYEDSGGRGPENVRDDSRLLIGIRNFLDDADIIIAQNGKRFDIKKINARMAMKGIAPYSPIRVIDTYEVAKKHFGFTSNKLAWTSMHLTDSPKSEHKQFPGFELWLECLKDNKKAWKEMKKYNIQDIISLQKYYFKLRPWIKAHPNLGTYSDGEVMLCPKCGSDKLQKRGEAVSQNTRYQRYQCVNCGGWSRGKIMLTSLSKRRGLLTNISEE